VNVCFWPQAAVDRNPVAGGYRSRTGPCLIADDMLLTTYCVEKVVEQHPVAAITAKTNLPDKKFHRLKVELIGLST
jgi:hypothetical protein